MTERRIFQPDTHPYIRVVEHRGVARYFVAPTVALELDPAMCRLMAAALIRAAVRMDPHGRAVPPWEKPPQARPRARKGRP